MDARPRDGRPLGSVIGLTILLLALVAALTGHQIMRVQSETRAALESTARSASYIAASHASWVVEANLQAMRRVAAAVMASPPAGQGSSDLRNLVRELPDGVYVWVFDRDGNSTFTNEPEYAAFNAAGRDYFEAVRKEHDVVIGPMFVGRASARKQFTISQRIERDGDFLGVAVAFVPADVMAGVWRQMRLGEHSTIAIVRTDGWLVARYPVPAEPLNLAGRDLFRVHLQAAREGFYASPRSPADGVPRYVAYRQIEQLPLVAIIGVAKPYDLRMMAAFTPSVLIGAGLIAVSLALFRVVRREAAARQSLSLAVEQNEVLLREVHHRVKNNLQTISALVRLQPGLQEAKDNLFKRITAIATVHELMCESQHLGCIDLAKYLDTLLTRIEDTAPSGVAIERRLDPFVVHIDTAVPLGLIVNEAVSNAFKHAFSDRPNGRIRVSLRALPDGAAELRVADDGRGLVDRPRAGIGSRLMDKLSEQIGATYRIEQDHGTTVVLHVPARGTEG